MKKILISGYYGFENQGDEAILKSLVSDIRNMYENVEITVLTANAEQTQSEYNVKVVNRNKYISTLKTIYNTDLVISGGGSLLQDVTSPRSLYYYLTIIFLGVIFNKKIMLLSHGFGPVNNVVNRFLTKNILNRVDYISVRENHSKSDLIKLNVKKEIVVTADPVIDLICDDLNFGNNLINNYFSNELPCVGISIRTVDFQSKEKINELKRFVDIVKQEVNLVFLPFHMQQDMKIIEIMREIYKDKNILFLCEKYSVDEMLSLINSMNLLIGVRLHSLIFAAVVKTPIIGISYDPKIDYFLHELEMNALFDIKNFNADILKKEMHNKLNCSNGEIKHFESKINDLKGKYLISISKINELINFH